MNTQNTPHKDAQAIVDRLHDVVAGVEVLGLAIRGASELVGVGISEGQEVPWFDLALAETIRWSQSAAASFDAQGPTLERLSALGGEAFVHAAALEMVRRALRQITLEQGFPQGMGQSFERVAAWLVSALEDVAEIEDRYSASLRQEPAGGGS